MKDLQVLAVVAVGAMAVGAMMATVAMNTKQDNPIVVELGGPRAKTIEEMLNAPAPEEAEEMLNVDDDRLRQEIKDVAKRTPRSTKGAEAFRMH